ncbi:hypothetical protein [Abyssisolibacter fermentans]|uniref:hypothetical protein n=1 Tax=Abyssisolibacter fermentans TaxID=1766203 RepID=UPI0012E32F91|nr:hypothetical protein [Abyssisolibacter fermentans]
MKKLIKKVNKSNTKAFAAYCGCQCSIIVNDRYCDYAYNYNQHNDPDLPYI